VLKELARIDRHAWRRRAVAVRALTQRRAPAPTSSVPAPAPDDLAAFLQVARQSFVQLQAAWDRADLGALGSLTTEPLFEELREQLSARGPGPNRTEVLALDARVLALDDLNEAYVASVEFSGLIRERADDAAVPFRELWLLANLKSADRGWRLARIQALA
jgi:predicted lipid-binding transport protein (Tim44 family)